MTCAHKRAGVIMVKKSTVIIDTRSNTTYSILIMNIAVMSSIMTKATGSILVMSIIITIMVRFIKIIIQERLSIITTTLTSTIAIFPSSIMASLKIGRSFYSCCQGRPRFSLQRDQNWNGLYLHLHQEKPQTKSSF